MSLCAEQALAALWQAKLDLQLHGQSANEERSSSQLVGAKITPLLGWNPKEWLSAHLAVETKIETGSTQARYLSEFAPKQRIRLREGAIRFKPFQAAILSAGAIDQALIGSKALLSEATFPALSQEVTLNSEPFYFKLLTEQAMATTPEHSFSLGQPQTPLFFYESVAVGFKPKDVFLEAGLGHYAFTNLPSSVAYESRFSGNSVVGTTQDNSFFLSNYKGFEIQAQGAWQIHPKIKPLFDCRLQNTLLGSKPGNGGLQATTGADISLSPSFVAMPRFTYFYLQSDVSPAYYNHKAWGHNNREGFAIKLAFQLPELNMEAGGEYSRSHPIRNNPYQRKLEYLRFFLGVNYDVL